MCEHLVGDHRLRPARLAERHEPLAVTRSRRLARHRVPEPGDPAQHQHPPRLVGQGHPAVVPAEELRQGHRPVQELGARAAQPRGQGPQRQQQSGQREVGQRHLLQRRPHLLRRRRQSDPVNRSMPVHGQEPIQRLVHVTGLSEVRSPESEVRSPEPRTGPGPSRARRASRTPTDSMSRHALNHQPRPGSCRNRTPTGPASAHPPRRGRVGGMRRMGGSVWCGVVVRDPGRRRGSYRREGRGSPWPTRRRARSERYGNHHRPMAAPVTG